MTVEKRICAHCGMDVDWAQEWQAFNGQAFRGHRSCAEAEAHKSVLVSRADLQRVVDYFGPKCRLDHNGCCQEHTVSDDCFVPRLVAALEEPT